MKKTIPALLLALAIAPLAPFIHAAEKGDTPAIISHGEKVTLAEHLVAGKTTVVDFTSKYCPPCVRLSPLLDKLHAQRDDIAVVKVDINRPKTKGIDWKSPVAQQYQLKSIPHFQIYDAAGNLVAEGKEARAKVSAWLEGIDS
ncbi:thioredoxin family protein [Termitidicoccus mucosus]|uniref:Thioredoxin domain-containing protein n=1 Tax=Termitidicoccus mucosus TaxID=1184151 RepID=A0A178IHF7_9BACT|nr:hypothetical protein AW736_13235 [Opitutaceae bacterium TSB47]